MRKILFIFLSAIEKYINHLYVISFRNIRNIMLDISTTVSCLRHYEYEYFPEWML